MSAMRQRPSRSTMRYSSCCGRPLLRPRSPVSTDFGVDAARLEPGATVIDLRWYLGAAEDIEIHKAAVLRRR